MPTQSSDVVETEFLTLSYRHHMDDRIMAEAEIGGTVVDHSSEDKGAQPPGQSS